MNFQKEDFLRKKIFELVKKFSKIKYQKIPFRPGIDDVPVSGKVIGEKELVNMVDASLDGWLTTGRFNENFEKRIAEFVGAKYAMTVNSGSSANLVAFSCLTSSRLKERQIKKGDEVITVAAGFPTTVNPILQNGAIPVFVDIDLDTLNIKAENIEKAITPKTKAIMLAHTLGNPFNLDLIKDLCLKYNLWLIEDCCDALGSTYNNKMVGTFGDIATLSFYPAHHITMGEGGAVLINNGSLKLIAESFRDWGRDCFCKPGKDNTCRRRFCWTKKQLGGQLPDGYDHKYIYSHKGYNLKITDMQASCALAQLESLSDFIDARKKNYTYLHQKLKKYSNFFYFHNATNGSDPSWFGFPITLKKNSKIDRFQLINYLNDNKIGTRLLFAGNLTKQPYMKNENFRVYKDLKNTDYVMNNTFWIGVFPGIKKMHLDYIVKSFEKILG
jgi:CDP-6-deoxy-D-xylo-4-hexulose-3-dehydrase